MTTVNDLYPVTYNVEINISVDDFPLGHCDPFPYLLFRQPLMIFKTNYPFTYIFNVKTSVDDFPLCYCHPFLYILFRQPLMIFKTTIILLTFSTLRHPLMTSLSVTAILSLTYCLDNRWWSSRPLSFYLHCRH